MLIQRWGAVAGCVRRCGPDDRRRSTAIAASGRSTVAERKASIDPRRQHAIGVEHMAIADDEATERRQRCLVLRGACALLAELPRRATVLEPLEDRVELTCFEGPHVQRLAAVCAPEVEVAELEDRVAREHRVACRVPRRRPDLDRVGVDANAAEQPDAHARRPSGAVAERDAAIEHLGKPMLDRADEERPADRFAEENDGDERDDGRDQHQRPANAATPGCERASHRPIVPSAARPTYRPAPARPVVSLLQSLVRLGPWLQ